MRPSLALDLKRSVVREAASRHHTANPRVFGSVLCGNDQDGSDLDLLVDALPGATAPKRPNQPAVARYMEVSVSELVSDADIATAPYAQLPQTVQSSGIAQYYKRNITLTITK